MSARRPTVTINLPIITWRHYGALLAAADLVVYKNKVLIKLGTQLLINTQKKRAAIEGQFHMGRGSTVENWVVCLYVCV